MIARRYIVAGRVQGVFFRAETKKRADEIGLFGWVRNRDDGTVEVHAEGTNMQLEILEAWLRQGPAMAEVSDMKIRPATEEKDSSFSIED